MALAEWHRREISVSVVRLRDGTLNYHVGYGFATEGTPLLDQAIVTARYGEGATLLRTLHTQPGGVLRPSSADLWIALERPTGTEIIARNAANGEVIHHHITQQRAAELIRNRMRSSPTGPEGGLERINPAELTLQQRQMLERVLGYRPPELP